MRNLVRFACVALTLSAAPALAGDAEAKAKFSQAYEHWNDEDPSEALRLIDEALAAEPEDRALRYQMLLFKGSLHQVKTGDLEAAREIYDRIIRDLVGVDDAALRSIKADSMVRKGNILYSENDDKRGALQLYISANEIWPKASTRFTASQLSYRMSQEKGRKASEAAYFLRQAVALAQEAVDNIEAEFKGERLAPNLAQYKVQLAIATYRAGSEEDAQAIWDGIDAESFSDQSLYLRAVWNTIQGDVETATEQLKQFLATRPTARTRNQLRKYIRNDPDFADHLEREDWQELVEDEPDASRPTSRPGRRRPR